MQAPARPRESGSGPVLAYDAAVRAWFLVVLGGCSFQAKSGLVGGDASRGEAGPVIGDGPVTGDGPITGDARMIDARPADAPPGCDGAGAYTVCLTSQPTQPLTIVDMLINTDDCIDGQKVSPGNGAPMLCVLAGTNVMLGGLVRGEGSLPLALLATGNLSLPSGATLDVSSSIFNGPGAAANGPGCVRKNGTNNMMGGSGGAGGSFGTQGGNGGNGASSGGVAAGVIAPAFLRGGCPGGNGGGGMGMGGGGGDGGGAVYVLARGSLDIAGNINASGGAGHAPGTNKNGGGAGGSGGMIALWAGTLNVTGELYANGGGGAGGSEQQVGQNGGESGGPTSVAQGGGGGGNTGDGGDGAISTQPGANGTNGSKGGGGGGGGVGVIRSVSGQSIGGMLSPPAS